MVTRDELFDRYDLFLIDAYGVLVHAGGVFAGAVRFLDEIRAAGKRFMIVTNDATRLPESAARRYQSVGLPVELEHIRSSGMLLADHFEESGLVGARCLVLGPSDSEEYVRRAGGEVAELREDGDYDAVIPCNDARQPSIDALDIAISALFGRFDSGRPSALVLPNPDIVYPKSEIGFGFTAGAAALLLEAALARRYPDAKPTFVRLGKPMPALFEAALGDVPRERALVIGDQLETDIAGAQAAGLESILVNSGVSGTATTDVEPTWRVGGLADLMLPR